MQVNNNNSLTDDLFIPIVLTYKNFLKIAFRVICILYKFALKWPQLKVKFTGNCRKFNSYLLILLQEPQFRLFSNWHSRTRWLKKMSEGWYEDPPAKISGSADYVECRVRSVGNGRTGHIFVYFAKKSVTTSLRQVRPVIFGSTKFCQGLPNFKEAIVLPRSRTNFCQAWNLTDLSIYTPWFEGKCQSRKCDLYF